jgi:hypothetical protein
MSITCVPVVEVAELGDDLVALDVRHRALPVEVDPEHIGLQRRRADGVAQLGLRMLGEDLVKRLEECGVHSGTGRSPCFHALPSP